MNDRKRFDMPSRLVRKWDQTTAVNPQAAAITRVPTGFLKAKLTLFLTDSPVVDVLHAQRDFALSSVANDGEPGFVANAHPFQHQR